MADKILVNYEGNVQPLVDALKRVEAEQAKVDASAKKTSESATKLAYSAAAATDARTLAVKRLEQELAQLQAEQKRAFDPKTIRDFDTKINDVQKDIKTLNSGLEETGKQAKKAFDETNSSAGAFNKTITRLGVAIAGAFAVDKLIAFGKEAAELARKASGVERAFERLNNPQLLGQLQKATKGLVSDLNLMTAAVRAKNFQIPLEQLPKLFEFAQRRAQETGESVDYLVESIILGIGRKSPMILDNLGISAVRLRENFKGTSVEVANVGDVARVVGNIVNEELAGMGENAAIAGDNIAKLGVRWENFKTRLGAGLLSVADSIAIAFDPTLLNEFTGRLDQLNEGLDNSLRPIQYFAEAIADVNEAVKDGEKSVELFSGAGSAAELSTEKMKLFFDELQKQIATIDDVANRLARYNVTSKTFGEIQQDNFFVQDRLFAAQEKARQGIEDVNKAVKDGSLGFTEGQFKIKGYELELNALGEALINTEVAFKKIVADFKALDANTNSGVVTLGALKETVTNLKAELDNLEIGSKAYNDTLALLKTATANLKAEEDKLKDSTVDGTSAIDKRIAALKDLHKLEAVEDDSGPPDDTRVKEDIKNLDKIINKQNEVTQQEIDNKKKLEDASNKQTETETNNQKTQEDDALKAQQKKQEAIARTAEIATALSNAVFAIANNNLERERMAIDKRYDAEIEAIDKQLESKKLSERQREDLLKQRTALEEKSAQEQAEIQRKQAINNKAAALFDIAINTARGIVSALSLQPPNIPLSIAIGVIGAAQLATAASQPIPEFAKGVVDLQGPGTGTSDSIHVKASKGESIIQAANTKKYRSAVEAIHGDYFDKYVTQNHVLPALREYDRVMNEKKGKDLASNLAASLNLQNIFKDGNIVYELKRGRWNGEANTDKIVRAVEKVARRKSSNSGFYK